MASKLINSGFNTTICEFPKDWRENGKVDFDSALAAGHTKEEFAAIMLGGKAPNEYLRAVTRSLDTITKRYIEKRIKFAAKKKQIIRWDHCYWVPPDEEDEELVQNNRQISNFVIDIKATYYDNANDGLRREIVITNEFGDQTRPRIIDPSAMGSVHQFKTFCYSQGNYMFYGNETNLMKVWDWEFSCDEGNMIYEFDHIGKMNGVDEFAGKDMWVTKDMLICDKTEYRPDDNGVFWVEGVGIRYNTLDADSTATSTSPSVCQIPALSTSEIDFKEMTSHYCAVAGEAGKLLIGWAVFSLIRPYLTLFNDITPYPFLYGEKGTGKTTVCQCLMALFGMPDFGTTFTDITKVAITRMMAYYSGFPVWIDEFSNDQRVQSYEPHLKSVYNRMPVIKGTRAAFGVSTYPIRSGLLLSGETVPTMDAVKQRSVLLPMKLRAASSSSLRWLERHKKKLGYFSYYILKNRHAVAKEADEFIKRYYDAAESAIANVDLRTLKHYSLFAGCYRAFFGEEDVSFNKWILNSMDLQVDVVLKDEVYQFFEDMTLLYADDKINNDFFGPGKEDGKEVGYIWLSAVYDKWKDFYSRHKEIHSRESLRESMKSRPYWIDEKRVRINGKQRRAVVIDMALAPEIFKDLIESSCKDKPLMESRLNYML